MIGNASRNHDFRPSTSTCSYLFSCLSFSTKELSWKTRYLKSQAVKHYLSMKFASETFLFFSLCLIYHEFSAKVVCLYL